MSGPSTQRHKETKFKQINGSTIEFYIYTAITLAIIWGCIGMMGYLAFKFFLPLFTNISGPDILEMTEDFIHRIFTR